MSLFAYYDHTVADPSPVIGWIDSDVTTLTDPVDPADLFEVPQGLIEAPFTGTWAVSRAGPGSLVPYAPVAAPLTLDQQTSLALAAKLAAGIVITAPAELAATYGLDANSTTQIAQIGSFAGQFGNFPDGGATFTYPSIQGLPMVFDLVQFIAFWRVTAAVVWGINQAAAVMRNGGTPTWPSQSATIA
jgi:hypothetical protein